MTVCAASVAVDLSDWAASWAGCLSSPATSEAADDSSSFAVASGPSAFSFSAAPACSSSFVAGIRLDTSMPTPNAITPTARGLPSAFAFTV